MASGYLTGLAAWCRAEGCQVKEWAGWERRSASMGGFVKVMGIAEHHTAAPVAMHGERDWQYATYGNQNAPEYNIGIDPSGMVNILAAGGVNGQGRGGPLNTSQGVIPPAGSNYRAVAISYGNNGTGESYSAAMMDAGVRATAAVVRNTGLKVGDSFAHKEWCGPGTTTPGRKIDPYGPWVGGGDWGPQQGRIDVFRSRVYNYLYPAIPPIPAPTGKGSKRMFIVFQWTGDPSTWWVTDTVQYRRIWDFNAMNLITLWQSYLGYPPDMRKVHQLDNNMIHTVGAPAPGVVPGPWPAAY